MQQPNETQENSVLAKLCQSTINFTVKPGATLLFLPDPTVPYLQTSFEERRVFNCEYSNEENNEEHTNIGSIISVDWYGSGRRHSTGMEDERWAFDYLSTRMELHITKHQQPSSVGPVLIESLTLDNTYGRKDGNLSAAAISLGKTHDSYATLLLHGPNSLEVAKRATVMSKYLARLKTRVRQDNYEEIDVDIAPDQKSLQQLVDALGGKVLMSVAPIEDTLEDEPFIRSPNRDEQSPITHMVRILAESNEDIYRVLHFCLKPCSQLLGGIEPYKDRIHSSATVRSRPTDVTPFTHQTYGTLQRQMLYDLQSITNNLVLEKEQSHRINDFNTTDAWFYSCLFSDSSLPVGSFAHSLGTEAASQMGLFNQTDNLEHITDDSSCSVDALEDYIYSVSRSNARVSAPIILAAYSLVTNASSSLNIDQMHQSWLDIDHHTDTLLKSNGPGRRASIDQGLGFLRIAPSLLKDVNNLDSSNNLWQLIRRSIDDKSIAQSHQTSLKTAKGHAAPIYGILSASLGVPPLDACRVFAFAAARDSVSAAVRLNLLGPVAGLLVLNQVGRKAVEEGLEEGLMKMFHCTDPDMSICGRYKQWLDSASTCAPLMDVVQPCHDMLSVRLFRT
jgi:urease accessory protein